MPASALISIGVTARASERSHGRSSSCYTTPMEKRPTLLSWSSGKDSAWALHVLREEGRYGVVGLVTTINEAAERVAMHAVRSRLLDAQASAVGLPLWKVPLPSPCTNEEYEARMSGLIERAEAEGITAFAFGDLFLDDIRAYREKQLGGTSLEPVFPLWMRPTRVLAAEMIRHGVRAKLTCVDPSKLDASFAGRDFDAALLHDLPAEVDPCGENGEFHSFVYDGPMMRGPIPVCVGEVVEREGFVFADVNFSDG
jgi:uncharacterized protein (TIGR00290 family)